MAAQGLRVLRGIDGEHLLQQISGCSVGHDGGEMRLKPVEFRCRPAMPWPGDPSLAPATRGTAKAGKPHCDLAEKRSDHMVLIVLHPASTATAAAGWSPSGVIPDLCRDDLLLKARQQPLRLGQGQTQFGDIGEITEPVDLHNIRGRSLAFSTDLHHPHNPGHASTPGQRTDAKIPLWRLHPKTCGSPGVHAATAPLPYAGDALNRSPMGL